MCTRIQKKGAVIPQETDTDLAECLRVTGRGVGRWWQAARLRVSVAAHAWKLLKEVAIIFILNSIQLYGCIAHHLSIQLIQDTWVVLIFLVILTRVARNIFI